MIVMAGLFPAIRVLAQANVDARREGRASTVALN
jgi:hypothetical protein